MFERKTLVVFACLIFFAGAVLALSGEAASESEIPCGRPALQRANEPPAADSPCARGDIRRAPGQQAPSTADKKHQIDSGDDGHSSAAAVCENHRIDIGDDGRSLNVVCTDDGDRTILHLSNTRLQFKHKNSTFYVEEMTCDCATGESDGDDAPQADEVLINEH